MEENKAAEAADEEEEATESPQDPCLWITDVREGSPAADAGLLLGDAVLSFGDFIPTPQMTLQEILEEIKQVCIETTQSDKVTIFVTVQRRSLFGDVSDVVIMLYSRACVDEDTNEVGLGCELKTEPIF